MCHASLLWDFIYSGYVIISIGSRIAYYQFFTKNLLEEVVAKEIRILTGLMFIKCW